MQPDGLDLHLIRDGREGYLPSSHYIEMPRRLVIGKTSEEIIKCHIGKDVEPPYSYYTVLQAEVLSVDSNNIKSLCLIGCMHSTMIYCQFLAGCLSLNGG